jgi:hypothetical protein
MLADNKFELDISSFFGVQEKRAFATINIRFRMADSGATGPAGMTGTLLGTKTTKADIEAIAMETVNSVLRDIAKNPEPFLLSVRQEEDRQRKYYGSTAKK